MKDLAKKYPVLMLDDDYEDYYTFIIMILQLSKPFHLFTLNETLCPSQKEEILLYLCQQNEVEYLHPYRKHEISAKPHSESKTVLYVSDNDEYFDEIIG